MTNNLKKIATLAAKKAAIETYRSIMKMADSGGEKQISAQEVIEKAIMQWINYLMQKMPSDIFDLVRGRETQFNIDPGWVVSIGDTFVVPDEEKKLPAEKQETTILNTKIKNYLMSQLPNLTKLVDNAIAVENKRRRDEYNKIPPNKRMEADKHLLRPYTKNEFSRHYPISWG
jgi:hypothetical protein